MPQTVTVKARGLYISDNPLDAPEGSLTKADNAVIRRADILEAARGYLTMEGAWTDDTSARPRQILNFGDKMLVHDGSVLSHYFATDYINYNGTYTAPDSPVPDSAGEPVAARMRWSEAGGALYFTTSLGLYRLDDVDDTAPVAAGVPAAQDPTVSLTGSTGFLATANAVAYRVLWGIRDGDGAVLLGPPSGRVTITNASGGSRDVAFSVHIPSGITTRHFLQVYRTSAVASTIDPGDDMSQSLEVFPTTSQVAAGILTFTDIAGAASGPVAYFNANGGEGLGGSKNVPPVLTDVVSFKGYQFGVVHDDTKAVTISVLAVGGTGGINAGESLIFTDGTNSQTLNADTTENATLGQFQVFTGGTAAQNIENTAKSMVRATNFRATPGPEIVYATYASGPNDPPGIIVFYSRTAYSPEISVISTNPKPYAPNMGARVFGTTISRSGSTVTVTLTPATSVGALSVGQVVTMTTTDPSGSDPQFPLGDKTITSINTGAGQFTYTEAGTAGTGGEDTYVFESSTTDVVLRSGVTDNSWAHSSFEEPDAWPPDFRFTVGGPDSKLLRITQQSDSLLFWTTDGVYRLVGTDEDDFTLRPVDNTLLLVAEDSPANVGGRTYALTNRGVVAVSETGVETVSDLAGSSIQQALLPLINSEGNTLDAVQHTTFGVAYESEHEYWLWLPTPDAPEIDGAGESYTFNAVTRTWVHGTFPAKCGLVPPGAALKLGATDVAAVYTERRDYGPTDYEWPGGEGVPFDVEYNVNTARNPAAYKQWQEATILLAKPQPSSVGVTFATELSETPEGGTIPTQGNAAVRTYVPREKARSARLAVGIQHDTAGERIQVLGVAVTFQGGSPKVGR